MDGFQLTIVAMAFSDSQWQDDWNAIRLAEKRRAEFLGEAEYGRLPTEDTADRTSGRNSWSSGLRKGLLALHARIGASRRPDPTRSADLAPAAETA
jgi:hypothetical protein